MGTDKAMLSRNGRTLLEHAATQVEEAAGTATIIGDPSRYGQFRWPVIQDLSPGCGPLGGIITALEITTSPWNLITACDMPRLDSVFLAGLLRAAAALPTGFDSLVPLGPGGPEPLCAVYHRLALPELRNALERNILKMRRALDSLAVQYHSVPDMDRFLNINTPGDWFAQ
jgi:molybdopterin-guanine dinucleotide biosynthesis protein A